MTHAAHAPDPAHAGDTADPPGRRRRLGPRRTAGCSSHPFYRRWEAGELRGQELAEYAVHYRAFEAVLPAVLAAVVDRLTADGRYDTAGLVVP